MTRINRTTRRGFATLIVLWVIAIASVILVSLQTTAWRDAADARQAVAQTRAKWAARAGVEAAIASLAAGTLQPDLTNAFTVESDLEAAAAGTLAGSSYSVARWTPTDAAMPGALDEHSKININTMTAQSLILLPYMTEDVADAILDWIDADEDARPLGAEVGYYASLRNHYPPRNAPVRSLQEIELIAGVRAEDVRGEDWNLNGRLDPEEDDGELSWPPDNADGKLDAGWSAIVTASSADGVVLGASGEARLDLVTAASSDIASRLGITADQAETIAAHAQNETASMGDFLRSDLNTLAAQSPTSGAVSGVGGGGRGGRQAQQPRIEPLTDEQLALLLAETTMDEAAAGPFPGKLNLNTCPAEVLQYLPGLDPGLADSIIFEREARTGGFASIVDVLAVPAMSRNTLAGLLGLIDVRSNVYTVTSRGRDSATGLEVEISATVDRSSLPVVIKDMLIR